MQNRLLTSMLGSLVAAFMLSTAAAAQEPGPMDHPPEAAHSAPHKAHHKHKKHHHKKARHSADTAHHDENTHP